MKIVSIHEAKSHLSRLIREAQHREEIVIARGKTPIVKLVLVETELEPCARVLGTAKGKATVAADFDEPLDDFAGYR